MKSVSILIPAHNEADRLKELLKEIRALDDNYNITVIDSASTDNTKEVCSTYSVQRTYVDQRGKGRALRHGIAANRNDIIVMIDGDNSYSASAIPSMLQLFQTTKVDIVYGSRFLQTAQRINMPLHRYVGNALFRSIAQTRFGRSADFTTGLTAVRRKPLQELALQSNGFEFEAELFCKALVRKWQVAEVPVTYTGNTSSKIKPVSDGMRILWTLIRKK